MSQELTIVVLHMRLRLPTLYLQKLVLVEGAMYRQLLHLRLAVALMLGMMLAGANASELGHKTPEIAAINDVEGRLLFSLSPELNGFFSSSVNDAIELVSIENWMHGEIGVISIEDVHVANVLDQLRSGLPSLSQDMWVVLVKGGDSALPLLHTHAASDSKQDQQSLEEVGMLSEPLSLSLLCLCLMVLNIVIRRHFGREPKREEIDSNGSGALDLGLAT